MPVLDNALLACALAFTPLMFTLTFGEPADAGRPSGARRVPSSVAGRPAADTVRQAPAPGAAVLQGLFFGRIAPHRKERRTLQTPAARHRPPP